MWRCKALGIWLAAKPYIGHRTKIDRFGRKAPHLKKIFRKATGYPNYGAS